MPPGLLTGPLLALLLAQAEAAPPPVDPGPAPAPAGPAETAPTPPAPAAGKTTLVTAADRAHVIGFAFGGSRRLGQAARDIPPRHGLAVSGQLGRRYLLVDDRVDLGLAFQFGFARFKEDVVAIREQTRLEGMRMLTHYDLSLVHTAALVLGPVRPFLAFGGGISLAHFSTIEDRNPDEARTTRASLMGAVGLDVAVIADETRVGLELDGIHLIGAPALVSSDGSRQALFGNRLSLALWLRQAF